MDEDDIKRAFIEAYNTLILKKDDYIKKRDKIMDENDLLVKYHAKDFEEIVKEGKEIKEADADLVFRMLKQITVMEEGKLVVSFHEGTEIVV